MKEKVLKIVSQVMDVPFKDLNEDSSPGTIENWDSLKHMSLILTLEEEFNLTFSDKEIVDMLSVGIIVETLTKKL